MTLTVVPFNYDLETNPDSLEYDGVFISNGPGDPTMCTPTVKSISWLMRRAEEGEKPVPIFGICLGNQLLALAAGAKVLCTKELLLKEACFGREIFHAGYPALAVGLRM